MGANVSEERSIAVRNGGQLAASETRALWAGAGNANSEVMHQLGKLGDHYGLSAALGEIMILGNKVYIPLEGYISLAERNPAYDGYEIWPLTEAERTAAKAGNDEHAWGCNVYRKDRSHPSRGYGFASDRTVQAAPLKAFAREVAQARAFRRALRAAFRATVPPVDEDGMLEIPTNGTVVVSVSAPEDVPPKPPAPPWDSFWIAVEGLGVSRDEAHRILGVESIKDWTGSLEEAYQRIEKHVAAKERADEERQRQTNVKKWTREKLIDHYARRCDDADVLGIPHKPFDLTWTDEQIISEGEALKAAIKGREATIPSNGSQS